VKGRQVRTVRIGDGGWDAVQEEARLLGVTTSEVVRTMIEICVRTLAHRPLIEVRKNTPPR
jgi:hypothetical protein